MQTIIKSRIFVFVLMMSFLAIGCVQQDSTYQERPEPFSIQQVKISAHRGGPTSGFPENCLETLINTAKTIPKVMLEVDVRMTKDSVLILLHDETLERTSTISGRCNDLTFNEITKGDLIDNKGVLTTYKVPGLIEVLSWLKTSDAFLSVDVKDKWVTDKIVQHLAELNLKERVEIITYNNSTASRIHNMDSTIYISASVSSIQGLEAIEMEGVNLNKVAIFTGVSLKDSKFYNLIRKKKATATLGTMGNLDQMAATRSDSLYFKWLGLGIDRIATDRPFAVNQILLLN